MNYIDTFIEVADDCSAQAASVPASKAGRKTMPMLQYEMIAHHPYQYTQEDVLFETYADYNQIESSRRAEERERFFAKDQACLRSSSLGKRYGWGIHCDAQGKLALFGIESEHYQRLASDPTLQHVKALRSKRVREVSL